MAANTYTSTICSYPDRYPNTLRKTLLTSVEQEHCQRIKDQHEQERVENTDASQSLTRLNTVVDEVEPTLNKDDHVRRKQHPHNWSIFLLDLTRHKMNQLQQWWIVELLPVDLRFLCLFRFPWCLHISLFIFYNGE